MDNIVRALFSSKEGECAYKRILAFMRENNMVDMLRGGALIGLSGGADSVFLSLFIKEYQRRTEEEFPVLAVHINHMIRGEDAYRDEGLSRSIAGALGFDYLSFEIDVQSIASNSGDGLELAARNVRYSKFDEIIKGRKNISCIITAHNSTDNVETVIFNLSRGCGLNGASGIAPVRDNIIRPLLPISKSEIVFLLNKYNITFAVDETNFSTDYTRNYIRHEILPKLDRINPKFEYSFRAFSDSALEDNDFLSLTVDQAMNGISDVIDKDYLLSLHPAIRSRVVARFCAKSTSRVAQKRHVDAICELLSGDNFRVSVGNGFDFVCERGVCRMSNTPLCASEDFRETLAVGENKLSGYNAVITIYPLEKSSLNIYNKSIKADLSSAIINGELYVRFKRDGDAYHYGGMTRKLKKVFNDLDILPSHRGLIPVICDDNGIVWVPGLGVRDDCSVGAGYKYGIVISLTTGDEEDVYLAHKEIH